MNKLTKFAALSLMLLSGCVNNEMNIKEAQYVAIAYQGEVFTPPPRSIEDIVTRIDETYEPYVPCTQCGIDELSGTDINYKLQRLSQNALVFHTLGQTKEAVNHIEQAIKMVDKTNSSIELRFYKKVFDVAMQIYESTGQYSKAVEYGERAANYVRFRPAMGDVGNKVIIFSRLSQIYARSGYVLKAEGFLDDAEEQFEQVSSKKGPSHKAWSIWKGGLAYADAHIKHAKGDLRGAEQGYRKSMEWFEDTVPGFIDQQQRMYVEAQGLYLVEVLLDLGRISEAELESRTAIGYALDDLGKNSSGTASVIMGLAKIMMVRGRYDDAEKMATLSNKILKDINSDPSSSYYVQSLNLIADARLASGEYDAALKAYIANDESTKLESHTHQSYVATNLNYSIALMKSGELKKAVQIAINSKKQRSNTFGDTHYSVNEAETVIRLVGAIENYSPNNLVLLQDSIFEFASGIHNRSQEMFILILDEYMNLLATHYDQSNVMNEMLFQVAQLSRSQKVQKALSSSAIRSNIREPKLAKLIRQEQDAEFMVDAAYNSLARGMSDLTKLKQVENLRRALDSLRNEISKKFPEYENLIRPKPSTISEVRQDLKPDEVMVSYYFGEKQGYVWAIPKVGQARFSVIPMGRNAIDNKVDALRGALDSQAQTISGIPDFDLKSAHAFYKQLLKPVEGAWKNAKSLIIVPHGKLASLPLGTLVTSKPKSVGDKKVTFDRYRDVSWLASTHAISYLPSVGALKIFSKFQPVKTKRVPFVGFGNPIFSNKSESEPTKNSQVALRGGAIQVRGLRLTKKGNLDKEEITSVDLEQLMPLPETESELKQVAAALGSDPSKSVFVGVNANEQNVKTMSLEKYRVLMFASHALIPGDLDGLDQPAIALSSPTASNSRGDGLLTMSEVLGLKLNADWVVLSACNTGAASGQGAEAISGLGMAFFYAGSRSLLVTHWPVETYSARQLTTDIFKNQQQNKKLSRTGAISKAVRTMIKTGEYKAPGSNKALFSYSHPMFWAPFTLIGDGRG